VTLLVLRSIRSVGGQLMQPLSLHTASALSLHRKSILDIFTRYDANKDGLMSKEELCGLIRVLDKAGSLKEESIDVLLRALDRNCDGFVDIEEFVEWAMTSCLGSHRATDEEETLSRLVVSHVFMTAADEANMERHTMYDLRTELNNSILTDAGFNGLGDPLLLVLSVGSSSTQAYNAQGYARSFPVGTKVRNCEAYKELTNALKEMRANVSKVLLMNSIGYQLSPSDPCLLPLSQLAARFAAGEAGALETSSLLLAALQDALPDATMHVYNRAKDPATKRYKYPQVINDFSEALASQRGLSLCSHAATGAVEVQDAIVDWGGSSYKVYVDGKRVGTEIMDANTLLCEGNALLLDRIPQAIGQIKTFVLEHAPDSRRIFIAQTGKARELALSKGIYSCTS
jgi:hypothetical protein